MSKVLLNIKHTWKEMSVFRFLHVQFGDPSFSLLYFQVSTSSSPGETRDGCFKIYILHHISNEKSFTLNLGSAVISHYVCYNIKGCRMGRSEKVSLWYNNVIINQHQISLFYIRISNC